jgi:hypothetical protein
MTDSRRRRKRRSSSMNRKAYAVIEMMTLPETEHETGFSGIP